MMKLKSAFFRLLVFAELAFVASAFAQIKLEFKLDVPDSSRQKFNSEALLNSITALPYDFTFDPVLAAQFQKILDSLASTNKIMGVSSAIIMPEKGTWLGIYGMSDPEIHKEIRSDMLFDIGSNTKTFFAALVLLLEEEGLLTIEDPLSKWLLKASNKMDAGDD